MSYEQFWDGDVEIAKAYRDAHEIRLDEQNQFMWLQGMYVYEAIGALSPALKAFSKGRARPYLKHPFGYEERQQKIERMSQKKREADARETARSLLEVWAINFNEKWDKKENAKETASDSDGTETLENCETANQAVNGGEDNGG